MIYDFGTVLLVGSIFFAVVIGLAFTLYADSRLRAEHEQDVRDGYAKAVEKVARMNAERQLPPTRNVMWIDGEPYTAPRRRPLTTLERELDLHPFERKRK